MWSPPGVHLESTWSPSGVHQDCIWSLPGVQTQYQEFTWTPDGVHQDPWGSVTYSSKPIFHIGTLRPFFLTSGPSNAKLKFIIGGVKISCQMFDMRAQPVLDVVESRETIA
jgi:hypothetical protein